MNLSYLCERLGDGRFKRANGLAVHALRLRALHSTIHQIGGPEFRQPSNKGPCVPPPIKWGALCSTTYQMRGPAFHHPSNALLKPPDSCHTPPNSGDFQCKSRKLENTIWCQMLKFGRIQRTNSSVSSFPVQINETGKENFMQNVEIGWWIRRTTSSISSPTRGRLNRLFKPPDLCHMPPESGDFHCKSRKMEKTI